MRGEIAHTAGRRRRRRSRGQAVAELTMMAPFLIILCLGSFDIQRVAADGNSAASIARGGLRVAQQSATSDIGAQVRNGATATYSNSPCVWGAACSGSADDCVGAHPCGDPNACAASSSFWTTGSPTACFAVTHCTVSSSSPPTCPYTTPWGTRPTAGSGDAAVIIVAARYQPLVGLMSPFTNNGYFYVATTLLAVETY